MARAKPWLKLWTEWIDDPKILRLTLAERGAWVLILSLAQKCDAGGSLVTSSGSSLTLDEIMEALHVATPDDVLAFINMVSKMQNEQSLVWNDNTLQVIHFAERQELVPSETPEAVRERQRRHREKEMQEVSRDFRDKESSKETTTTTKDKEGEGEGEEECHGEKPVTQTPHSVSNVTENPLQPPKCHGKVVTKRGGVTEKSLYVTEKSLQDAFLAVAARLSGWALDADDDERWFSDFMLDFPAAEISDLKGCADYYSSNPPAKKGVWKNRFRQWLIHKAKFEKGADHEQGFRERGRHPPPGAPRTVSLQPIISGPDDEETGTPH